MTRERILIGVISAEVEKKIFREFFKFFKTAWEFYSPAQNYDTILSTQRDIPERGFKLGIIYGSDKTRFELVGEIRIIGDYRKSLVKHEGVEILIYRGLLAFEGKGKPTLEVEDGSETAGLEIENSKRRIYLIGYNLFEEGYFFFSSGQLKENALIPTLEGHKSILRDLIRDAGIPVVEIPPSPCRL
jgi:hypothetical protein